MRLTAVAKAGISATMLAAALAGGWYWQSPIWAISGLRQAAVEQDAAGLSQRVDIRALRDQLRLRLGQAVADADSGEGEVAGSLGAAVANALVYAKLDLGAVQRLVLSGDHIRSEGKAAGAPVDWEITSRGLNTFRARAKTAAGPQAELMFRRDGLAWKLVGIGGVPELAMSAAEQENLEDLVLDFPANRQDRRLLPNGADFLGVSGTITNVGYRTRSVPSIAVTLRDGAGRVVYSHRIASPESELGPQDSVTINEAVTDFPAEAATVEIGWTTRQGMPARPIARFSIAGSRAGSGVQAGVGDSRTSPAETDAMRMVEAAAAEATAAAMLNSGSR